MSEEEKKAQRRLVSMENSENPAMFQYSFTHIIVNSTWQRITILPNFAHDSPLLGYLNAVHFVKVYFLPFLLLVSHKL